jgi:hypothetical protein
MTGKKRKFINKIRNKKIILILIANSDKKIVLIDKKETKKR